MNEINTKYFAGHESFYLREGWMKKALDVVVKNPEIFLNKNLIYAINELGVGSNMVKSMRYWLEKCKLIKKDNKSHEYSLTQECLLLRNVDPYFQNPSTLWIIHNNICENSIIWELLFVEQEIGTYTKETMLNVIENRFKEMNITFASKTIKDSLNAFVNNYSQSKKVNDPEDNIISPLSKLKLLTHFENKYRFRNIDENDFKPLLVFYLFLRSEKKIQLNELYPKIKRIMKIELNVLRKSLDLLENDDYIKIDKAAGLNNIIIKSKISTETIIKKLIED